MGRLERHLDMGLIRRLRAGIRYRHEPIKEKKVPRRADSYRAARHNARRPVSPKQRALNAFNLANFLEKRG
jgi:hypothetical protein